MELKQYLAERTQLINQALAAYWPEAKHPLFAAMNYSLLDQGDRKSVV